MILSPQERLLCQSLRHLPRLHGYRYDAAAERALLETLFRSLAGHDDQHLRLLFPDGPPTGPAARWSLREAQGAVEGAEYGPAGRGKPCGHIFKNGEATYRCKTCSIDDTCVLCSRCFDASDHAGHMLFVSISLGNSGCCDCGDQEAWRLPVNCAVHTAVPEGGASSVAGTAAASSALPDALIRSVRLTVARALDYICDVISCSPEQLRLPKSEANIRADEQASRLTSRYYDGDDTDDDEPEFALILWNDEKHTVEEVQDQVARACKQPRRFGFQKANETNDLGRSIIHHDRDISRLLARSRIIEQIKVTVTVRSSRDTFREQMCGTIVEWLVDVAGCSVGGDHDVLRQTICEEMLRAWRTGSEASNAEIGRSGIDDQEKDESEQLERIALGANELRRMQRRRARARAVATRPADGVPADTEDGSGDDEDEDGSADGSADGDDDDDYDDEAGAAEDREGHDAMELDLDVAELDADGDLAMESSDEREDDTELSEATYAGYPPPPPPPAPRPGGDDADRTPSDSDTTETAQDAGSLVPPAGNADANMAIPRTPSNELARPRPPPPPRHWLEKPQGYDAKAAVPLEEDLWRRVRLDWMILFDLRMWKKARIDLRDLYITTVVTIPRFKRILGLRFAGLYTTLAQLYLIADREPDHSIINLSLQMLTTPSITDEVVERGNFLTNLIAILYTFLTTRQVGHPQDVHPTATLAFEAGSLTNRRMYHFFMDLRYLFGSEHVQEKLRREERYMLQFLDLVRLHQGICPNVRAVGDHIEYETDAWISASLITRELNRLCRQFAESFRWARGQDDAAVCRAIRLAARAAVVNSTGSELRRFDQAEIKEDTRFKRLGGFALDTDDWGRAREYRVVRFTVEKQPISFHHGLHYTLSWLVDCGKGMSRDRLRALLRFTAADVGDVGPARPEGFAAEEDYLMALFDFPLRVCAWLAQMKAGMWVRNGLSLRHQMSTYRGVSQRDVAHQRDIFLLQTALVTCDPSRVLASMIDRFGMDRWMVGSYQTPAGHDENQVLDVAEDLVHLLIVLLCDRTSLIPLEDEPHAQTTAMRRDIAHVLCFKPLSFSELAARLADRLQDMEEFQDTLDDMTRFRPPEGLSDSGTFELKEEHVEEIDPYIAHYSKNQREESENAYRARVSKRTGRPAADVVFEPRLRPIESGVFVDLAAFTRTDLFAHVIYSSFRYLLHADHWTPSIPSTRLETFLHVVLHLTLLAVNEDATDDDDVSEEPPRSFVNLALTKTTKAASQTLGSIVGLLHKLSSVDDFRACQPKIRLVLRRMQQRRPRTFASALAGLGLPFDRMDTSSPASMSAEDVAMKKKLALDRRAKVMAQFQQQQQNFLDNQGDVDWGDEDFDEPDDDAHGAVEEQRKMWRYPSGTCILCQEETNDSRLYGTFALIADSNILRQTDLGDADFLSEAAGVPSSLDRSADDVRPYGVSGQNREILRKLTADGSEIVTERQRLGKGFPAGQVRRGPVTTGCGHIMHYACFEHYYQATQRRQDHQIARAHPERLERKEFVCPLCKALGNAFLPIIWKGKEELYPGVLQPRDAFDDWLCSQIGPVVSRLEKAAERDGQEKQTLARYQEMLVGYISKAVIPPLANKIDHLSRSSLPVLPPMGQLGPSPTPGHLLDAPPSLSSPHHPMSSEFLAMVELANIYKRLRDTIKLNQLPTRYSYPPSPIGVCEDLPFTDTLARTLGFSISAVEIAQRGVQSEPGSTLLDKISQQSLTLLRILSETVSSFIAIGGMLNGGANKTVAEFADTHRRQLHQLFVGHPQIFDGSTFPLELKQVDPLLTQDPFVFLAECSVCIVPALHLDVHHVIRLCYLAELVKVVMALIHEPNVPELVEPYKSAVSDETAVHSAEQLQALRAFAGRISDICDDATHAMPGSGAEQHGAPMRSEGFVRMLRALMGRYALCFLRKTVILLHARFGVDFPDTGFSDIGDCELDRLSKALRLESLDAVFASFVRPDGVGAVMQAMASGWIRHWVWAKEGKRAYRQAKVGLSLSHPVIFELVGLPKNFDTLSEEAMRRRCPTTTKELTDPSVCLFCGAIFCSQAQCCSRDGKIGGCNQHRERCGQHIGLFINIRKCTVLYLHDQLGSWHTAPYLDKHGEVDAGLRRNRQLFLNQKRYDALLRNVWLQHGIPTTISRKLEADVNSGGWETI
ncbi:MAG: hypothetical protein M1832_001463 [Thelocarpon impressellum]|nr:MAG: hypothetical protein M1832_001463 [Thelocarpon impressellum]